MELWKTYFRYCKYKGFSREIAEDLASEMCLLMLKSTDPDKLVAKKYLFLQSYRKIFGRKCERIFVPNFLIHVPQNLSIIDLAQSDLRSDILVFPDPADPTDKEVVNAAVANIKAKSFAKKLAKLKEFGACPTKK